MRPAVLWPHKQPQTTSGSTSTRRFCSVQCSVYGSNTGQNHKTQIVKTAVSGDVAVSDTPRGACGVRSGPVSRLHQQVQLRAAVTRTAPRTQQRQHLRRTGSTTPLSVVPNATADTPYHNHNHPVSTSDHQCSGSQRLLPVTCNFDPLATAATAARDADPAALKNAKIATTRREVGPDTPLVHCGVRTDVLDHLEQVAHLRVGVGVSASPSAIELRQSPNIAHFAKSARARGALLPTRALRHGWCSK